jgi:hypothetical protein
MSKSALGLRLQPQLYKPAVDALRPLTCRDYSDYYSDGVMPDIGSGTSRPRCLFLVERFTLPGAKEEGPTVSIRFLTLFLAGAAWAPVAMGSG